MSKKSQRKAEPKAEDLVGTWMPMEHYRMADFRLANIILHGTKMMKEGYRISVQFMKWPHGHRLHTHDVVCQP